MVRNLVVSGPLVRSGSFSMDNNKPQQQNICSGIIVQQLQETFILSLDEDIAKLLNENISFQDSNCLAEVLGDYFTTSDNGK